ncbi:MAG: UDP-2,3-diacylglucosamine diphosphatase [Deltaproteobacteria bacterium]|nr:UDP-2,3-diacylglucosamine diphosphatase [Deltaproteobacteria bacterium]
MVRLIPQLTLPASSRLAIISDLHLADGSHSDLFCGKDALLLQVLESEPKDCDALVLNGDIFDHQRCPDHGKIERAHAALCRRLRQLARRMPVIFCCGNHDHRPTIEAAFADFVFVDALTVGQQICITHGHQFDIHWADGPGSHGAANLHARLERLARQPIRQPLRDYDNWANRVVHRVFFRWTQLLRLYGVVNRALGRNEPYRHWQRIDNFWARGQWGDIGNVYGEVCDYLPKAPYETLIIGHSHHPGIVPSGSKTYVNNGSWVFDQATLTRIQDGQITVQDQRSGECYADEGYRRLFGDDALPDMAEWFRRYYRPLFRYDLAAINADFPRIHGQRPIRAAEPTPELARLKEVG